MGKLFDLQEDIVEKFKDGIGKAGLDRYVNVRLIGCQDQKPITKVAKANPVNKWKSGDDVDIMVNEYVFDRLPENMQTMVIEETLARVVYDPESDKIAVKQPDFEGTFSLFLRKHGFESIERLRETIKAIYSEKAEAEQVA